MQPTNNKKEGNEIRIIIMHYIIRLWTASRTKNNLHQPNKLLRSTSIRSYLLSLSWVRETRMGEIDKLGWLAWFVKCAMYAFSSSSLVHFLSV
jgi:hypothetical protein